MMKRLIGATLVWLLLAGTGAWADGAITMTGTAPDPHTFTATLPDGMKAPADRTYFDVWRNGQQVGSVSVFRVDGQQMVVIDRNWRGRSYDYQAGDTLRLPVAKPRASEAENSAMVQRVQEYQAGQQAQLQSVYPAYLESLKPLLGEINRLDAAVSSGVTYAEYCSRVNEAMAAAQAWSPNPINPVTGSKYKSYGQVLNIIATYQVAKDQWTTAIGDAGTDQFESEMSRVRSTWNQVDGLEAELTKSIKSSNPYDL